MSEKILKMVDEVKNYIGALSMLMLVWYAIVSFGVWAKGCHEDGRAREMACLELEGAARCDCLRVEGQPSAASACWAHLAGKEEGAND